MMQAHFAIFAAYNLWANTRLYAAASVLPDAEYRRDCGAFFGSVHGTLNHILVADRIWMRRFTGAGEAPSSLDAILFEDLDALARARRAEDERIIAYIGQLSETDLHDRIRYRMLTQPTDVEQMLSPVLAHFFNHQTHHRGQVHALLTRLSGTAPSLDLQLFVRESGIGL